MARVIRLRVVNRTDMATVRARGPVGYRADLSGIARSETLGVGISVLLYLLLCLVLLGMTPGRIDAQTARPNGFDDQARGAAIRTIESSEQRIVLEVEIPTFSVSERVVDGIVYDVVSHPDWGLTDEAGAPQLPRRRVMLGIPAGSEVRLDVVDTMVHEGGPHRIMPVPEVVLAGDSLGQLEPWKQPPRFEERFFESPAIYEKDALYPSVIAKVAEVGSIRSQRVAAIDLYPVQYNPLSRRMVLHSRFRVELSLSYPRGRTVLDAAVLENPSFERLLQGTLLNYPAAKGWRGQPAELAQASAGAGDWPLAGESYKIFVSEDGLYQLTYDNLADVGVPVDSPLFDPSRIQVFSGGEEVAIRVVGEEDGFFDADDYVLFYGQGIRNKYTERNVYWLRYDQAPGRRISGRSAEPSEPVSTPSAFTSTLWVEEDNWYSSQWPGDDGTDRWFWRRLDGERALSGTMYSATMDVDVELGNVAAGARTGTLRMVMKGQSTSADVTPDHHARFYVNGHHVGDHWWNGMETVEVAEMDVPSSHLTAGINTFSIVVVPDAEPVDPRLEPEDVPYVDSVLFDRFELSYGHAFQADSNQLHFSQAGTGGQRHEITGFTQPTIEVYDISDPISPTRFISLSVKVISPTYTLRFSDTVTTTRTYLALTPERWLSPEAMSKDLPSDLHNAANGADYIVITHARFEPAAQALANYRAKQGLRTKVVDVDDIYDEFGYGLSIPQAIRDFVLYAYGVWQEPAPSYIVLLGDGTYDPKNHLDQGVDTYIPPYLAKVDPWMGEAATDHWFVAVIGEDNWEDLYLGRMPANTLAEANVMVGKTISYEQSLPGDGWNGRIASVAGEQPDADGAGNFHDLSEDLISGYVPVFYDVSKTYLGNIPGSTCSSGTECRQQLVDRINAGTLLVNYIGHGSVIQWDGAHIFDHGAIHQLTNRGRYPIMLPMTCLEGMFTSPDPALPSISESVVRVADKGAVASWGPTGLGVASGHDHLNKGFLQAVLWDGVREMGAASYAGKLRLESANISPEQIQEYTVFGDPALRIHSLEAVDVRVDKTVEGSEAAGPGDILTFTLAFTNAGPDAATGVLLSDSIPSFLLTPTVVYSSPEVLEQHAGVTFTWTISDLLPHTGGEIRIRAVVDPGAEHPVSFFNSAVITSTTPDLVPANNRSWIGINTSKVYLPLLLRRQ